MDSESKINAMASVYIDKLGFKVCSTNVGAQKIDNDIV